MRSSGVHHVDLVVSSIERSLPFYRELLAPLGYHRIGEVEGERGETIWYLGGPGSSIGLRQAQAEADGVSAGSTATRSDCTIWLSRLCRARSSTSVTTGSSRRARRSRSPPSEYSYIPGYYAVFFYDPDGIKLEIVHVPGLAA